MHPHRAHRHPGLAIVTMLILFVALGLAGTARADAPPGCGQLELRWGDRTVVVPAVRTDIDLEVTGPLIRAVVRQDFTNPAPEVVSARYLFPLPPGAAVAAMELRVGERRIVSVVKEKEAARADYEQARREGRKAALVSAALGNLFATEVANLAPGETVSVRLEYLDTADYADGWFSLACPLTFTPRFFPEVGGDGPGGVGEGADDPAALVRRAPFVRADDPAFPQATVDVALTPGLDLAEVVCPSHATTVRHEGGSWLVAPTAATLPADRDFVLRWRPVADALARPLLFSEDTPDGLFALLMVVPGDPGADAVRPPTDTVFVIDVSGSMGGPSIDQARRALATAIDALRDGDRFTILAFDDRTETWAGELQPVETATRQAARTWVRYLEARGGTRMHPALLRARLLCGDGPRPGRARQIILLTDAAVGNEDQLLRETVAGMKDVRLHVVGIGPAPNRSLVRRLAGEGGGLTLFVAGGRDDPARLTAFLARVGQPQWVDPRLDWQGAPEVEGYPDRLPAPVPGQLVLWSGRFPAGTDLAGTLVASGPAGDLALHLDAVAATPGAGLATRGRSCGSTTSSPPSTPAAIGRRCGRPSSRPASPTDW